MVFLKNGFFFHPFDGESYNSTEQFDFINLIRECSSVTGACFLMERKTEKEYEEEVEKGKKKGKKKGGNGNKTKSKKYKSKNKTRKRPKK